MDVPIKLFVISCDRRQIDSLVSKYKGTLNNSQIKKHLVDQKTEMSVLDSLLCVLRPELIVIGDVGFRNFTQRLFYNQWINIQGDWGKNTILKLEGNYPFNPQNDGRQVK